MTAPPTSGAATTSDASGNAWTTVLTRDDADAEHSRSVATDVSGDVSGDEDVFEDASEHLGVVSAFWEEPLSEHGPVAQRAKR